MNSSTLWRTLGLILILWLAIGLRLYRIDVQSIWWDEGHSIFVASHPIAQIPSLPAMDVHPPAYFALLHLWMELAGRSEFALRFLSVIFSILTVALLWRFAASLRRMPGSQTFEHRFPIWVTLLAAVSPLYIAYGQEVRSYAMITFLALASTFALWCFTRQNDLATVQNESGGFSQHRRKHAPDRLLLYVILTAACLYTHYFTIFLLLFQNLVWLLWVVSPFQKPTSLENLRRSGERSRASRLMVWLFSQLAIFLLFTPQLMLALRQVTSYTNPNLTPPTLASFTNRSWQAYTVGLTIDPIPARWGMLIVAAVLIINWLFWLIFGWRNEVARSKADQPAEILYADQSHKPPRSGYPQIYAGIFSFLNSSYIFLIAWFLLPLAAYFIILQRQPSFEPRYMMLITPALFLLLAFGLTRPLSPTQPTAAIQYHVSRLTMYALLVIFLFGTYHYFSNERYFKDASADVADWLAAETTTNDIVYVDVPHPFHYYAEQRHIPAPSRYLFVDIHTAADTLNREASGRDRLFWVTWRGSDTDPRGVIPYLAKKAGRQLDHIDFKGYRVQWFELSSESGTAFSLPNTLTPLNATFGDILRLDGAAFGDTTAGAQPEDAGLAWATLHFTLLRETTINYKVSLRLRAEEGQIAAQADRELLNDRHFRTSAWPLNDPALNQAINVYALPLPADLPAGSYQLEAVIYNAEPPYPSEGVTGIDTNAGVAAILGHLSIAP